MTVTPYDWIYESLWNIPPFFQYLQQGQQSTNLSSMLLLMAVIINNAALWGMPHRAAIMEN